VWPEAERTHCNGAWGPHGRRKRDFSEIQPSLANLLPMTLMQRLTSVVSGRRTHGQRHQADAQRGGSVDDERQQSEGQQTPVSAESDGHYGGAHGT